MSLNFGMPVGFADALDRKYAILGQDAAANTVDATARAKLADANAGLTTVNAGLAPGLAKASEAASYGSAKANVAQAGLFGSQTTAEDQLNQTLGKLGIGGNSIIQSLLGRLGGGSGFGLTAN